MSKRTANNDNAEVTIIRTSDGCKRTFQMSLSNNTLTTLKQQINSDPQLGPLPPNQQRLFHLGREIKSPNRSLEALGIGKFRVFTVHLHPLVTCLELLDSDVEEEVVKRRSSSANGTARRNSDEDEEVVDMTTPDVTARFEAERARRRSNNSASNGGEDDRQAALKPKRNDEVVDLLDSSDDDDDDVVEIVECTTSSGSKRRKRN